MSKGRSGLFDNEYHSSKGSGSKSTKAAHSGLSNYQKQLIREVQAKGEKITPKNVVDIGKTKNGKIMWIETGNDSAGLDHILNRHGKQFIEDGFTPKSLSKFLIKTILAKQPIGYAKTGNKNPSAIYKVNINGKTKYIAITIGSNGFIIGAHYITEGKIIWKK